MVRAEDFDGIDRLCRYLDIPFDLNEWTRLYEIHKEHTLTAYFELLRDDKYEAASWQEENQRWLLAKEEKTIDEEIQALSAAEAKKLIKKWSSDYSAEELHFLENFYNQIVATQNVSTPILQEYARDLCEIELRIKKGLRAGADVKKDMDARDNIIKIAKFDASNSKVAADFESIGELMVYYGKQGWHPKWHKEPQDSVDFCMKNIQSYLQRLVTNEGNFVEQVEDKREKFNTTQRIEEMGEDDEFFEVGSAEKVDYEDEDEAAQDLSDWDV
jgi:predicted transcriptional regulator